MTSTIEFLSKLHELGIDLRVDGERLLLHAPKGVVSAALKEEIAGRKEEILLFLRNAKAENQAVSSSIPVYAKEGPLALSFTQERLWLLEQLSPGNYAYNMAGAIRLKGKLNRASLEQTLNEILARHDVLRANFVMVDDQPAQVIAPYQPLPLKIIDLTGWPAEEQAAEVSRLTDEEAKRPFDLSQDLLVRRTLVKLSAEEHIFLLTMHHIVSDGLSISVFSREFAILYRALVNGLPNPLSPLHIQYTDFAQWQHEWLKGEVMERQLAYWKKQLASPLPVLNLPTDHARPKIQAFNGAKESLALSPALTDNLKKLSHAEGSTLFMVLLAAFNVLLYRSTGQADIVIGSPIAGRNRAELENLMGFFINTLVMRTNLAGNPNFRELIKRVHEVALEAYANQDIPFEKLVEELHPDRDVSRTPIFQIFFNMLLLTEETVELPGLTAELISRPEVEAKFDFTLYVREQNQQLQLILVYNADLFSQARMAEMVRQLAWLLNQVVEAPDRCIDDYSLLTPAARSILPDPTIVLDEPEQVVLPELITAWARQNPDGIAIEKNTQRWTYQELQERASLLACQLINTGLKPGDVVAVGGSRSFNLIASMLAVFLSGGVLLCIDDNLPDHRKELMYQEADAKVLIHVGGNGPEELASARLLASEEKLLLDESSIAFSSDKKAAGALRQLSGNDPAYIFFTSGTTGVPKGVMGTHKGLSHFLNWQRETFAIQPGDRAAQLTALSFDVVLRDVFLALVSGATLCLPDDNLQLDADETWKWLQKARISIVHTVPTLAQSWLNSLAARAPLSDLRWAFFAGEPLKDSFVVRWRETCGRVGIVNLYGPTETTMAKCFYQVPESVLPGVQPVGRPLPQTQAFVINAKGQLCGIGEPGEIVIRTPFRTRGYVNAPEENTARFVKNPFRNDPEDKIYHTGDQGRFRPDGQLDIQGRLDGQVKLRGIRIELSEIETALQSHPAIKQSAVVVHEASNQDKLLVAYLIPNALQFPKTHELKGFLQQRLPSYMIPASFILLDKIPTTANGKLDRRALPKPDLQTRPETTYVAPKTQLQELLVEIWANVLQLEQVGVQDNFFDLGGHSLLATQIISRTRRLIQTEVPVRLLFEFPTIEAMSTEIEGLQRDRNLDVPPLRPYPRSGPFRLSFSQERLWFVHQLAPESAAYNISTGVRLHGELDPQMLEQTFNIIIDRHEILRTTFDILDGEPVQIVAPSQPLAMPIKDLTSLNDAEKESEVERIIDSAAQEPFDLVHGPVIRAFLIRLNPDDHVLFTVMHHIVSDQWSGGVFSREFTVIYNALSDHEPIPLSDLTIQYGDYSQWQRDSLKEDVLKAKLAFWKKRLEGISVLDLPTDYPRPAVQTFHGTFEELPLPASVIDAIRNLCRQEQITPFMFFLAIFKVLLFRYTGQQDIAVGSPIANRNWFETENLIGTFINTVVLRTQLTDSPSVREFLHSIRELSLEAFNHQDLPFEKLVEELQPERNLSHTPLVQVLFNVLNTPFAIPQFHKNLSTSPVRVDRRAAQFDLSLSVSTDVYPRMTLTYNIDLYKKDTIVRMLGHLETLIGSALVDPSQRLLDLPMLTQAEREQQLFAWNSTKLDFPRELCVHNLVELQAQKTPHKIAVTFYHQGLTYQELNSQANQLAHHLRKLGVTAETPVGISMERSAEMIIGLLGILKAGGTYIPLDPLFPQERLEYMLENSETSFVVTQERIRPSSMKDDQRMFVRLDTDRQILSQYSTENLSNINHPEDLAYIIFTSGSTGKPKGVQIPHRAVVNFLTSMRREPGLTADDRLLAVTTLSFDISVLEVFLPLATGACVVVAPGEAIYDGTALMQQVETNDITVMQATPATWQMLIAAGWQGNKHLKVLCGGEAMPKDLASWLTQRVGCVWNMYGPTETTVWSTICEIRPDTDIITIGRPISNTQTYVLDKKLEPVPAGVVGELYIGGEVSRADI